MRFSEEFKIAPLAVSANVTTAGVDSYSVHMGKVHNGCWQLNFGTIASDDTLKVYVGASQGTKTTAIAFYYRLSASDTKSALSDTFGAFTAVASSGLTLTAATYDSRLLLVEVDSQAIADATPYVTLEIAGSATTQNVSITFIGRPRFSSNDGLPSVL